MSGSSSYWKKREQEEEAARQKYIENEVAYQKEIDEIYASQIKSINDQIYAFYAAYASKEGLTMAETKKAVSNLDIKEYAKKAKKYVAEKDFSNQANEEMRIYNLTMKVNRLELLKANIGLELVSSTNELQKYFDQILTSRTLEEFKRQAGILGSTVQDNSKFAETIVNASFHNATWSDRIWANQEYLKAELNKTLSNGLIQGLNPRALAPSIAKSCGVSKKNALRLMRTELARVQTQAQVESYNRNGYDEYIFLAERTACTECLAINGKVFKVADAEAGDNLPPIHPNCRCSTAAYIDEKAYDQWLKAKANGETNASFEEWKQNNESYASKASSRLDKETLQNYKAVETSDQITEVERRGGKIETKRITSVKDLELYCSTEVSLKPREQKDLTKRIRECVGIIRKHYDVQRDVPKIVILSDEQIGNGTVASFGAVSNTIFIPKKMCLSKATTQLQAGTSADNDSRSTLYHEFLHWAQADSYEKKFGSITIENNLDYLDYINDVARSKLKQLDINELKAYNISEYAGASFLTDANETLTEMLVQDHLKK
jgi:SPP1 gp7 family putative phage head morphogenesis protein